MIQSHLLQVMAVVAMEAPASIDADDLRTQKELVLRAVRPWGGTSSPPASARDTAGRSATANCRPTSTRTAWTRRSAPRPSRS